jgi:hypothetical protein
MTTRTCIRRLVQTTFVASGVVLAAGLFGSPANADYKEQDFASCLERDMPTDYCCEHAGGVMRSGACIDPETLKNATAVFDPGNPLPTFRVPDISGPPLTAVVDPGPAADCTIPMGCNNIATATAVNPSP